MLQVAYGLGGPVLGAFLFFGLYFYYFLMLFYNLITFSMYFVGPPQCGRALCLHFEFLSVVFKIETSLFTF